MLAIDNAHDDIAQMFLNYKRHISTMRVEAHGHGERHRARLYYTPTGSWAEPPAGSRGLRSPKAESF